MKNINYFQINKKIFKNISQSVTLGCLAITSCLFTSVAQASTPDSNWSITSTMTDCYGTNDESYGATTPCQNYDEDLYENWNPNGDLSGDDTDIKTFSLGQDNTYFYFEIDLREDWSSESRKYYLEIEADGDGQSDYFLVYQPKSVDLGSSWKDIGGNAEIEVYVDQNNSIGGSNAASSDGSGSGSGDPDGYEAEASSGKNLAVNDFYVRQVNGNVQMALKKSIIGSPSSILSRAYASQNTNLENNSLTWHDWHSSTTLTADGFDNTAGADTSTWLKLNPNFNWYDLWDTGSTETPRTFQDVNGSGIDVTVEYSTGQRWQSSNGNRLNLYDNYDPPKHSDNDSHNLWIYHGILRFTNNNSDDNNTSPDSSFVKVTFSQPVYIQELWAGSLSTISDKREWMKVHAYSTDGIDFNNLSGHTGNLVSPSKVDHYENFFNTTCTDSNVEGAKCNYDGADNPSFVDIISNNDGSITLKGKGSQGSQQYGRAFFEYANTPVKTIVFEHFVTDTNDDASGNNGYTSVAISPNLVFSEAGTSTIVDSDNDGLIDSQDPAPNDPDYDDDGLLDGELDEPNHSNPDTDGDGFNDGDENNADYDGDGQPDVNEENLTGNKTLKDLDGDGTPNNQDDDSDGDGFNDNIDPLPAVVVSD